MRELGGIDRELDGLRAGRRRGEGERREVAREVGSRSGIEGHGAQRGRAGRGGDSRRRGEADVPDVGVGGGLGVGQVARHGRPGGIREGERGTRDDTAEGRAGRQVAGCREGRDLRVRAEVAVELQQVRGLGRNRRALGNHDRLGSPRRIDDGHAVHFLGVPAHDTEAVGNLDQVALLVEVELTVTGVDVLHAVVEDEEAFAADGQVRGATGDLQSSLGHQEVDRADGHTETDLRGVGAAQAARGSRTAAHGLRELALEVDPLALVADGVDVGDVVAQDVETHLVVAHAGDARVHGTKHESSS
ncbi:hypothetical protein D3C86_1230860 [compost metagenome]